MGLYEDSRDLVVVAKVHRPMHKDSNGAWQYTPDLWNVYFHVNERCIRLIFPYFNGRMLQICNQHKQFSSDDNFLIKFFKRWYINIAKEVNFSELYLNLLETEQTNSSKMETAPPKLCTDSSECLHTSSLLVGSNETELFPTQRTCFHFNRFRK